MEVRELNKIENEIIMIRNFKREENETIADCMKRFEEEIEIFKENHHDPEAFIKTTMENKIHEVININIEDEFYNTITKAIETRTPLDHIKIINLASKLEQVPSRVEQNGKVIVKLIHDIKILKGEIESLKQQVTRLNIQHQNNEINFRNINQMVRMTHHMQNTNEKDGKKKGSSISLRNFKLYN